jgi:hypothetical protein
MNTDRRDPYRQHPDVINRWTAERQSLLRRESEDYLRDVVLDYEPRRAAYWQRDYSSTDAYLRSVEANRRR